MTARRQGDRPRLRSTPSSTLSRSSLRGCRGPRGAVAGLRPGFDGGRPNRRAARRNVAAEQPASAAICSSGMPGVDQRNQRGPVVQDRIGLRPSALHGGHRTAVVVTRAPPSHATASHSTERAQSEHYALPRVGGVRHGSCTEDRLRSSRRRRILRIRSSATARRGSSRSTPMRLIASSCGSFRSRFRGQERLSRMACVAQYDWRGYGMSDALPSRRLSDRGARGGRTRRDGRRRVGTSRAVGNARRAAPIAIWLAVHCAERVTALVLDNASAQRARASRLRHRFHRRGDCRTPRALRNPVGNRRDAETRQPLDSPTTRDCVPTGLGTPGIAATPTSMLALYDIGVTFDVRDLLGRLAVPTLVLHSAASVLFPAAHGRYLAEHIPATRYFEVDEEVSFQWDSVGLVGEVSEFLTGSHAHARVDRSLLVVLFTDIAGSTYRVAAVGDAVVDQRNPRQLSSLGAPGHRSLWRGGGQHPRRRLLRRRVESLDRDRHRTRNPDRSGKHRSVRYEAASTSVKSSTKTTTTQVSQSTSEHVSWNSQHQAKSSSARPSATPLPDPSSTRPAAVHIPSQRRAR